MKWKLDWLLNKKEREKNNKGPSVSWKSTFIAVYVQNSITIFLYLWV